MSPIDTLVLLLSITHSVSFSGNLPSSITNLFTLSLIVITLRASSLVFILPIISKLLFNSMLSISFILFNFSTSSLVNPVLDIIFMSITLELSK